MPTTYNFLDPTEKQKEVIAALSSKDPCKFVIVCSGRQSGKTTVAESMATYWMMKYPKTKILWILPSEPQCMEIFKEFYAQLSAKGLLAIKSGKNKSKGNISLRLHNGAELIFKSAAAGENIRGIRHVTHLVVDEAAQIDQKTMEECIYPVLTVSGKKALIMSTPKGINHFYREFIKGTDPENKYYRSFHFTSNDNPFSDKEFIENEKKSLSDASFRQEYLAEFVDGAGLFRNVDEVCIGSMEPSPPPHRPKDLRFYFGIDVGLLHDETAIVIIDNKGVVWNYESFTNVEFDEAKERIKSLIDKWKPSGVMVEQNSIGLPLIMELKKDGYYVEGFTTTSASKNIIINRLVSAFSDKTIICPDDSAMKTQLRSFVFKNMPSGRVKYGASSGFFDDVVMALAIAYYIYSDRKKYNKGRGQSVLGEDRVSGLNRNVDEVTRAGRYTFFSGGGEKNNNNPWDRRE